MVVDAAVGAVVVVVANKDGAAPDVVVVAGAVLAGAVVAAGLAPNREGAAGSAGFEVEVAAPKMLDGVVLEADSSGFLAGFWKRLVD